MTKTVAEAVEAVRKLTNYAYEQGLHETGYDPVKVLADEIERLSRPSHEREPPHCPTCDCRLPVEPEPRK